MDNESTPKRTNQVINLGPQNESLDQLVKNDEKNNK